LRAIDLAKNELALHNYSCVVVHEDSVIMTSFENGVKPLINYYETKSRNFSNAVLADKVIGRAVAFLVVLCGITSVYAEMMSIDAKRILEEYNIYVDYDHLVPFIANRKRDGRCPMEELSEGVKQPIEMYHRIKNWLADMSSKQSSKK